MLSWLAKCKGVFACFRQEFQPLDAFSRPAEMGSTTRNQLTDEQEHVGLQSEQNGFRNPLGKPQDVENISEPDGKSLSRLRIDPIASGYSDDRPSELADQPLVGLAQERSSSQLAAEVRILHLFSSMPSSIISLQLRRTWSRKLSNLRHADAFALKKGHHWMDLCAGYHTNNQQSRGSGYVPVTICGWPTASLFCNCCSYGSCIVLPFYSRGKTSHLFFLCAIEGVSLTSCVHGQPMSCALFHLEACILKITYRACRQISLAIQFRLHICFIRSTVDLIYSVAMDFEWSITPCGALSMDFPLCRALQWVLSQIS